MSTKPKKLLARRSSEASLTFACILVLSVTPACAIKMARIAQFNEPLGGSYPCGDCRHSGRNAILGTEPYPLDSLVAYEYEGNNQFQRIVPGPVIRVGVWDCGDGNGDGLMDVVGSPGGGIADIWGAPSQDSFPTENICTLDPGTGNPQNCYPKFTGVDPSGHQEVGLAEGVAGVWLYEDSGNNCYRLAAVLVDSPPAQYGIVGDFDAGEFDHDSLRDLVTGNGTYFINGLKVFEATGSESYALAAVVSTSTSCNTNVAAASDMDQDGWPKILALGLDSASGYVAVVVCEATGRHRYQKVWEQLRPDFNQGMFGNPISVGDVDGDKVDEFAVIGGNGSIALFKCTGLHTYEQVWSFNTTGSYLRLFDINQDGRSEVIFDGPNGTEIWEDTEGLSSIAEFNRPPKPSRVAVQPTIAALGSPMTFSGLPLASEVEIYSITGQLVRRQSITNQTTWLWDLRDNQGRALPAGTYFSTVRSLVWGHDPESRRFGSCPQTTQLKLCIVR